MSSYNGIGFRLMFSPLSQVLSIHYFSLNPFSLPDNKKPQQELLAHLEMQTQQPVSADKAGVTTSSSVFLARNKRIVEQSRDLSAIDIRNNIVFRVSFRI